MRYAVKCMVSTSRQSGAQIVMHHKGAPKTYGTAIKAAALAARLGAQRHPTGLKVHYAPVPIDAPGWLSSGKLCV